MRDQDATTIAATGGSRAAARRARARISPVGQRSLALQAAAGNAAVVQLLRQAGHPWAQHQHGPGCGHQATEDVAVQRSTVHDVLRSPGRPLDTSTRVDMEARFGADFSDVRIHNDTAARASTTEIGAHAYTSGNHIVLGDGGNRPHVLAHELTHVIQQRRGPVAGSDNGAGLSISDPSDRFEREAEATATRVMQSPPSGRASHAKGTGETHGHGSTSGTSAPAVQRARMETRNTLLYPQQGPSCWLYVLEALARAHGLDTSALRLAMFSYPNSSDLDDDGDREAAVRRLTANLDRMIAELADYGETSQAISRQRVEEMAERNLGSTRCVLSLRFQTMQAGGVSVAIADVEGIIDAFSEAREKAGLLLETISESDDPLRTILGAKKRKIRAGDPVDSVREELQGLRSRMPVYLGVRKRFKPRPQDTPGGQAPSRVDWTSRTDAMESTVHAVLLTGYRPSQGIVSYKDPNFGDIEIRITVEQFQRMAGDHRLTVRPYRQGHGTLPQLAD
ncbi:eCIS core domain-containing protein [Streptomyces sp. 4N509B]|uniref:eCIS core domain-containing protein n=1 Tax=Streptomyces sp. 4N509B TaxID=3457413 RepID=UPI003FD06B24